MFRTNHQRSAVDPALLDRLRDTTPEVARHQTKSPSDHEAQSPIPSFDGSGDDDDGMEAIPDHRNACAAGSLKGRLKDNAINELIAQIDLGLSNKKPT